MLVKDVMTTKVITVSSDTPLAEAKRIMRANRLKRLPVVDKDKLMGVVTENRLERIRPREGATVSVWELSALFERTPVSKIMQKDVITVTPDTTVEEAVALAQENKIGALIVLEGKKLAGIVTTNDFFYSIANRVLGIGDPGMRVMVTGAGEAADMEKVMGCIARLKLPLVSVHLLKVPKKKKKDAVVHVNTENVDGLLGELKKIGYMASVRKR